MNPLISLNRIVENFNDINWVDVGNVNELPNYLKSCGLMPEHVVREAARTLKDSQMMAIRHSIYDLSKERAKYRPSIWQLIVDFFSGKTFAIWRLDSFLSKQISMIDAIAKQILLNKKTVYVPDDAERKLLQWRRNHSHLLADSQRIPYGENEIASTLKLFETQYNCNWHVMKQQHQSNPKSVCVQIINDLRSCFLEEIFEFLKKEYAGVLRNISDFGCAKLLSDKDFAFEVKPTLQANEAEIVHRFNQLFEEQWGVPSALVFDANAYTMQYKLSASTSKIEQQRSQLQQQASLLMRLRCAPDDWVRFKALTLLLCVDERTKSLKAQELADIEALSHQLQDELNLEILTQSGQSIDKERLSDPQYMREATAAAQKLKGEYPFLTVQTSNALHERYKTSFKLAERQKSTLLSNIEVLEKMVQENNNQGFSALFNKNIKMLSLQSNQEIRKNKQLCNRLHVMTANPIEVNANNVSNVMAAFKEKLVMERQEQTLRTQRMSLEKSKRLLENTEGQDLTEIHAAISTNEHQLKTLSFNKKASKARFGVDWKIAGIFARAGDCILYNMQRANILGMCFAQEPHISEGAFAFTVLNQQAGYDEMLNIHQYVQAVRELSGYYFGHQVRCATPTEKVVESSKYACRLITCLKAMQKHAGVVNVSLPHLPDTRDMEKFFKTIAHLRNTATAQQIAIEVAASAEKYELIAKNRCFNETSLSQINEQIDRIAATLEAWIESLPKKNRYAFYI